MATFPTNDPSLSPASRTVRADGDRKNNFIKNIFPEIMHFLQQALPFPVITHVVPDIFIQIFKLRFNFHAVQSNLESGATETDIAALIEGIDIFQINDVRDVTTIMSSGKNPGSANFSLNEILINKKLVDSLDLAGTKFVSHKEKLKNVDNTEVMIDFMDILKVYERNRFTDDYTSTFTGFITSIGHKDQPKVDFSFQYGAHDVTTALRLAPVLSQISMQQLQTAGADVQFSIDDLIWNNPLLAGRPATEILSGIIEGSWWTYPQTSQLQTQSTPSDNKKFTKIEILNPSEIGLLKLNIFPSDLPDLEVHGRVFSNNLNLTFYEQRDILPYDVCKDVADCIGMEFYGTPEGNLYFGIPKWDIDIDGSYYNFPDDGIIERKGYYDLNGNLSSDPNETQDYIAETDIYTINEEEVLSYEDQSALENVVTRVDIGINDWTQDVLKNKNLLNSVFGQNFFFSYPDLQFWDPATIAANPMAIREMTKYGIRPFPVKAKVFLETDESVKSYAQFIYDRLKGMRKQAKLSILPRPEIRAGRTIRIPYKNLIAYVLGVTNSVIPKKSASTVLQLAFIRAADLDPDNHIDLAHVSDKSTVEEKYGSFIPAGTFDFTKLQVQIEEQTEG